MKKLILIVALTALILSCSKTEPPPTKPPAPKPEITLAQEDASAIEAWIKITTTNIQLPTTVTLKKNNTVEQTISLLKQDSVIYIDSLLPKTTYTFQASIHTNIQTYKSNELSVETMDTTSQNFTFETFEFGDGYSSSYFNDVFIFNENDVWACGNVFTDDSTDGNLYHWNGDYWKAIRLNFVDMEGIWGIDSIIYLASNGLWKYDRVNLIRQNINGNLSQGQGVHKLWGSGLDNIWGIGPWGTIVHFDGQSWSKIDFDNQWYFFGITGDKVTGIAYAFATNNNDIRIIVRLNNFSTEIIHQSGQVTAIKANAINFISPNLYLAGSDFSSTQLWRYDPINKTVDSLYTLDPTIGINKITGVKSNDIYYWGNTFGFDVIVHFNGIRYKIFEISPQSFNRGGANTNGNISALVGFANNKAFINLIERSQ